MSLYPSLEDMKVGQMVQAQLKDAQPFNPRAKQISNTDGDDKKPSGLAMHQAGMAVPVYPSLTDYMGLDITNKTLTLNIPDYPDLTVQKTYDMSLTSFNSMVAPLSGQSDGLKRAHVSNGIRELILCKDKDGKVGVRVSSINSGVFVSLVAKGSPAEMGGLRFGDQVLQVNGNNVAGYSTEHVHKLFKKAPVNGISVIIRDRPFERTVTLHKDSAGYVGFQFKKGEVISLVKDSSASRNGLLTQHQLLEIDGRNVVGLRDKEITSIIENAESPLTITIMPIQIFEQITNK
ncbi:Syndecan Hypothetical protein protein [Nesidiocoris tenuis]|uniref:PDZ domain-containing protein n=1 Tax=Nesidiocoris tenuis TaxID=355587 RepID=A0ABN7AU77_9HEMI|nr:Syndecan Hypothetical protein protein [Nesidiocoris tenuis]